jgi:ligand-binding sensor domain-containing protein
MNKVKIHYLLIVFLLLGLIIHAQKIHFENLQLKGLPSTEVYKVIQDKDGFMWFATDAGVCKYDGKTLTTYTVADGLSENAVIKMKLDSKKRIWFATPAGYFFYYDNGHFTQIAANPGLKKICLYSLLDFIIGKNDTLIISGMNSGKQLVKVPPQNNYNQIIPVDTRSEADNIARFIMKNEANPSEVITFFSRNYKFIDSTYRVQIFDRVLIAPLKNIRGTYSSNVNSSTILAPNGTVYFVTRNKLNYVKDGYPSIDCYDFPTDILKIYWDNEGDLWIGTRKHGIYFFKNADLKKQPIRCLDSLSVSAITQDKEGSIWATTLEKGVFQCMNKSVQYIPGKARDFKVINNELNIGFITKKELFISTTDSIRYINDMMNLLPKNLEFNCFLKQKDIQYYGLYETLYSIRKNKIENMRSPEGTMPTDFLFNYYKDTVRDANMNCVYTIYNGKCIYLDRPAFHINFATQLPDKTLLVASRGGDGIFEFKNRTYIPYLGQFKELKTRVNWIAPDSFGNLWIATNEKGIYCYDKQQQRLRLYNQTNGLVSNKINTCAIASNGDIWCGTHSGLIKLTISQGLDHISVENFDKNHGLIDMEIEKITCFNNKVWCAGKTALFYFDEDKMTKNKQAPGIYIKSITIKNKSFPLLDSFALNYNQNDFRIQYELTSFKKTDNRTFFYKLDGYDNSWNISNTGDIQYTNIGFGNYRLLVYGVNNDGIRNELPLTLTLIIQRPFWFTWWFVTIAVILLFVFIYIAGRYWRKRIEKKERDKAAINQQLAEFKMTALRSQMNPHFIYNAIGSIQHYILKNEIDQSFNYLSKFSSLIRKVLNNSSREFITLEDEITTLQLYIDLEQIRFKHPFNFCLNVDEELDMETDIPTMLIQPYIENSIWHGLMPKELEGKLELIFKKVDSTIHVIIRDNGVGRDKGDLTKKYHVSKGMSLTQQRIQNLENISKKKFVTDIIDLKDENGNPIGTEVNLIIPFDE